jgi:hypothetical protein
MLVINMHLNQRVIPVLHLAHEVHCGIKLHSRKGKPRAAVMRPYPPHYVSEKLRGSVIWGVHDGGVIRGGRETRR